MRFFERRIDSDGEAPALTAGLQTVDVGQGSESGGRHEWKLGGPQDILDRSLGQKVLHGWLQNRHQVLVPLTFRLGRLEGQDIDLLMRFTAVALLNGSAADDKARRPVERWLKEIGAGEGSIAGFQAAILDPPPLSLMLIKVRDRELAPYAYAAAVVSADSQETAGRLFANFIAARLGLPADAVRSIDRRYRR